MNFDFSSCTKFQIFRGSALDSTGPAYSTPPDPLANVEGGLLPLPENPTPCLDPLGLGLLFFFIFKHLWAPKRFWKISHGGPGKVLDFLSVKQWEPCLKLVRTDSVHYLVANQLDLADWTFLHPSEI